MADTIKYSIAIPAYNEMDGLALLYARLKPVIDALDGPTEVIFVDDGSSDRTADIIREMHAADERIKLVRLSRNFGHQVAVTAGLELARGRAIVIMDADLQDPPELIADMVAEWKKGFDVVYAVRRSRRHEARAMTWVRETYYRLLDRISDLRLPPNAGDFRLLDRRVADAIKDMPETHRYVRGLCAWAGFAQTGVPYDRPPRAAGESKYPIPKLIQLALSGITGFSTAPLRFLFYAGMVLSGVSLFLGVAALISKLIHPGIIEGWTSVVIFLAFFTGVQMMSLGIIAEYVGTIFGEVKRRPKFIATEIVGMDSTLSDPTPR